MKLSYSLMAAALLAAATQVKAQSPTSPALGFQLFVQNDVTLSTSDCDGPIAMGGNLNVNGGFTAASHTAGTFTPPGFSTNIGLLVGGRVYLNSGNFQVNSNGYVKIGNSTGSYVWYLDNNGASSPIRITPDNTNYSASNLITLQSSAASLGNVSASNNPVYQSGLINFATAFTTMQATATSLAACTNNMNLYTSPNGGTQPTSPNSIPSNSQIYTSTNSSGVTVLNIDGTHLNNFQSIAWQLPSGSATKPDASHIWVINVNAPGSYTWNVPNMGLDNSNAAYVIWNFYNTTALTISGNGAVEGQVFAPYATITKSGNNANIEGQVIGLSYNQNGQGGEIHYYPMTTTVAGCGVTATAPTAGFTVNTAAQCQSGNSFTFTSTASGTTPAYTWTFGDNTSAVTTTNATHTYASAGTYTVKQKVTNSAGSDSTTKTVVVYATPAAPASFTTSSATVYQGQRNVTYTIAADTGVTYTWSYSGTGAVITGSTNTVSITFSTSATSGTLSVTKTSNWGCGTTSPLNLAITVKPYETFSCTSGNSWNTAANWDGGFVPYGTISAYIPAVSCTPTISVNDSVNNLIIDGGAKVSIGSGKKLNTNGDVTLNGTITGGYLNLSGTGGNQTLSGKGTVDSMSMTNTTGASINNGDTIHIKNAYKPGTGTLTTNGGLELLSDSSATAIILGAPTNSCNYISGNVICDKYIPGGHRDFRFFGHPFTSSIPLSQITPYIDITGNGGATNGFTPTITNNPSAFWFNTVNADGAANDAGWTAFTSTDGQGANSWDKFEGLRLFIRGSKGEGLCDCPNYYPDPFIMKMYGPINECDQTVTLTYNPTHPTYSYNFIGNPYPSNINMKLTTRGSKVGANFCVWDPTQGTQGAYVEMPFTYTAGGVGYILPAYSAFTTTCSGTTNNTIKFTESCKTNAAPSGTLFRTTNDDGDFIHLHVYSGADTTSWDRLMVFFNDQAVSGFDDNDGIKLGNPDLNFYSYSSDDSALAVDQRPFVDGEVVPLGFATDTLQTFKFKVDEMNLPAGKHIYLHDKQQSTHTELTLGVVYSFTVTTDPTTQGDRFELNLVDSNTAVNVLSKSAMHVNMYPNPASSVINVSFDAPQAGATSVTISNAVGQQLKMAIGSNVKSGTIRVPVADLAPGVYVVTFKCGGLTTTQRFVKE